MTLAVTIFILIANQWIADRISEQIGGIAAMNPFSQRLPLIFAGLVGLCGCAAIPQQTETELMEERSAAFGDQLVASANSMIAYRAARAAENKALCKKIGGVAIGMSPSQVRRTCWGVPQKVNETTTARGNHEQWVYSSGYVYFDNGVVSSIQTSR